MFSFKAFFDIFSKVNESRPLIGDTMIDGEYIEIYKSMHSTEDRHGISRQRNIKDEVLVDIINSASNRLERRKKNYILTQRNNKWIGIVLAVNSHNAIIVTLMIQSTKNKPPFRKIKNVINV